MASPKSLLSCAGVTAGYGRRVVLDGVSIDVAEGDRLGVLGHNGAGKSTLLRTMSRLLPVAAGQITLDGQDISKWPVRRLVDAGVVLVPQGRSLFAQMSVEQNVRMGAITMSRAQEDNAWSSSKIKWPWMQDRAKQRAVTLSGGQQQLVANARGIAGAPRLLIIDEPSIGLSGVAVGELATELLRLAESGVTVVLAEQNIGLALKVCTRFVLLRSGEIIGEWSREDLPRDDLWKLF